MLRRLVALRALVDQRPLILFTAVLLVGSSVYLTLKLCTSLGGATLGVLVAIGLSFEASKYVLSHERGIVACVVVVLLVLGSIAASLGHLLQTDAQQRSALARSIERREHLVRELRGLEEEAQLVREAASKDIQSVRYRTRGRETLERQSSIRAQMKALRDELDAGASDASTDAAPFVAMGSVLGVSGDRVRLGANLVVAVLLEVLGLMMLRRLRALALASSSTACDRTVASSTPASGFQSSASNLSRGSLGRFRTGADAKGRARHIRGDTGTDGVFDSRFRALVRVVEATAPGSKVRYRDLNARLSVGNQVLRRYFKELHRRGLVIKEGKAWVRSAG